MREIKFRAVNHNAELVFGSLLIEEGACFIYNPSPGVLRTEVYPKTIGQYTGLKDKNGREIYEGDILSFDGNMTADNSMGLDPNGFMYDESDKYQVIWHPDRAAFDLDYSGLDELPHWKYRRGTWGLMLGGNCEIIGNIYETPELLEK